MTAILADLPKTLWQDRLADPTAPETTLCAAMTDQGQYWQVGHALWQLGQSRLLGARAAELACTLWPGSIDMAFHAVVLGVDKDAALARLKDWVAQKNIKRATLANAYVQLDQPDQALDVLRGLDPSSGTYTADLTRRAELALWLGDMRSAAQDIAALADTAQGAVLSLRLNYQQDGAMAVNAQLDGAQSTQPEFWAHLFEIFINEGDFERAPIALDGWRACPSANAQALARAETRLVLERGDPKSAQAALAARLDMGQPWGWAAQDHVQYLRAGLLQMGDLSALHTHALAACRVFPAHDWLAHLARLCAEGFMDWRTLPPLAPIDQGQRLVAAGAATRMGQHARALGQSAALRRSPSASHLPQRARLLRAENFMHCGRIKAALKALDAIYRGAKTAGAQAEADLLAVELALLTRDTAQAEPALARLQARFPQRKAVLLAAARCAFFKGDFKAAQSAHDDFNRLKTIETGKPHPPDLRDRIVEDALSHLTRHDITADDILTRLAPAQIAASPALSAWAIARQGLADFQPDPKAHIPKHLTHYWEGPLSPALRYTQTRWQSLHPDFAQNTFDKDQAADWLQKAYGRELRDQFIALPLPAFRADLFRLAWIIRQGGIFADLDEYPRKPVTPWLHNARGVFCVEKGFGSVANNFIAAVPELEITQKALDFALAALRSTDSPYAWWHCGPAQMTRAVYASCYRAKPAQAIRLLSQSDCGRSVATNLPFPHKRSPTHWR